MNEETFGMKMLKKMGWENGKKIGKNPLTYMSEIKEIKKRKKGLGLGADNNQAIKNANANNNEKQKNPEFKLHQKIIVIDGKHKKMKGIIKKIEEENLIIQINNQNLKIPKKYIKILSKINHKNFGKNKNKNKNKELKKEKEKWVKNDLKIRIRSKKFGKGIYYLKKGIIIDIYNEDITILIDNNIVKGFKQKHLETLLPKINSNVFVVKGKWENKIGKLIKRDKKKNLVIIFLEETQSMVTLTQNEVCDFIN